MTDTAYARILDTYGFEFAGNLRLFVHIRSMILDNENSETESDFLEVRARNILAYLREVHRNVRKDDNRG